MKIKNVIAPVSVSTGVKIPGGISTRLSLPRLRASSVNIVDAVQIHILGVPGECRLVHAEVQIGRVHPFDDRAVFVFQQFQQRIEFAQVPILKSNDRRYYKLLGAVRDRRRITKARAYLNAAVEQSARHARAVYRINIYDGLPVFALEFFVGIVKRCHVFVQHRQPFVLPHSHGPERHVHLLINSIRIRQTVVVLKRG